jgi:hypothetical protein
MAKREPRQNKTRLASLVYLSNVLSDLMTPVRIAEDWNRPADLPAFVEGVEKRIRELLGFIDGYLKKNPDDEIDQETAWLLQVELDGARKSLDFLSRIGKAGADPGKSTEQIVREEIRRAVTGPGASATDFAPEAEELRKLRNGELKNESPSDSKRPQP